MFFVVSSLIVITLLLLLVCIYLYKNKNTFLMMILISITIFSATSLYNTTHDLLGYPIYRMPDETFILDHYIIRESEGSIYLWVRKTMLSQPRAHAIPYSKEMKEKLEDATEESQRTEKPIRGKPTEDNQSDIVYEVFDPTEMLQK